MDIDDFARRVAAELGPPWRAEPGRREGTAQISGPGHEILDLADGDHSHRTSEHGRVSIAGVLGQSGSLLNACDTPAPITVCANRHPSLAAADIAARFLPPYRAALTRVGVLAASEADRVRLRNDLLDELTAILAPARRIHDTTIRLPGIGPVTGKLIVRDSGSVVVELRVDAEHAPNFARALVTSLAPAAGMTHSCRTVRGADLDPPPSS